MQPLAGVARTWTRLPLLLDNTSQDGAGRFSDTMSAAYAILALQDDEATPPSHLWPVEEDSQARVRELLGAGRTAVIRLPQRLDLILLLLPPPPPILPMAS